MILKTSALQQSQCFTSWRLRNHIRSLVIVFVLAFACGLTGCTTKSDAKRQSRAAYLAGMQQAEAIRQAANSVTFVGAVKSPQIPWTEELTLAKALVIANYYPRESPKEIIVIRAGQAHRIDPAQLLAGNDFPLLAGDIVQIR